MISTMRIPQSLCTLTTKQKTFPNIRGQTNRQRSTAIAAVSRPTESGSC